MLWVVRGNHTSFGHEAETPSTAYDSTTLSIPLPRPLSTLWEIEDRPLCLKEFALFKNLCGGQRGGKPQENTIA